MPKRHERKARRAEDRTEAKADQDAPTPHKAKAKHGPYRLEYRIKPERYDSFLFRYHNDWKLFWCNYATAKARDTALTAMNRKDTLFEYRVKE